MSGEYGTLLDAVRGVHWPARRTVPGVIHGAHHSRLRGISPEFTEYRPYRQGDDPRRIDWKLLGRTDRASIRLSDDRAVLTTQLVVDASASMVFPERTAGKWAHARSIVVALAAIAQGQFDPVGLVVAAMRMQVLPPRARRGVVAEIASILDRAEVGGSPGLAAALARASRAQRVAIVSDFLSEEEATLRVARELSAAGVELHAVHVVAGEEIEPSADAMLVFDPEHEQTVRPLAEQTRAQYMRAFAEWREHLASAWRTAGAFYTMVRTDEAPWRAARRVASAAEMR